MGSRRKPWQVWADVRPHTPDHGIRRTATVLAVGAAVWPLVAGPAAAAATVPPVPSPATVLTIFPWAGSMEDELQGRVCQAPNNCVQIDQSLWDPRGLAIIDATIDATAGTKVVFSYSEGARSVTDWLAEHADDPDAPPPGELSFVLIGNPTRAHGGSGRDVMPQTQYQVIDISRQYDPASDFPDHPLNVLALLNTLAAFTVIHTDYENVDMYDPANIVWTEGNTTYVFVPTENLPLLEPLRRLGLTDLADALNGPLKDIVERGYDRSYLPTEEVEEPAGRSALVPLAAAPAAPAVESAPAPQDLDHHSGESDSLAFASRSDAGKHDADEVGIDADDAGATADGTDKSTATDSAEASTSASPDDDDSERTTVGVGKERAEKAERGQAAGRGDTADSGKQRNSAATADAGSDA